MRALTLAREGRLHVRMEDLWGRVKRWARRNGHEWDGCYGVVGVAAT